MPDKIIIIGASGHSKVIADIVLSSGNALVGFLDDNVTGTVMGFPVLGMLADIIKYQDNYSFIIGIGNNHTRKIIAEKHDVIWSTAIHPSAILARDVCIGAGAVVMAGAIVNPSATIGKHCIINTGAVLEHDNTLGDYVHISPHATLCGTVNIENLTHIGAGAVIKNNIGICENCIIGAGAVVVRDITEPGTYIGAPARRLGA